jgi:hypothetical protein
MADGSKASFLGSLSPWSRTSTPPRSPVQPPKQDGLKPTPNFDHSISIRPSPSLRRYPRDCPPLLSKWYYAVDVAKRKPFAPDSPADDKSKPPATPKKFVPFSDTDSQAIESAFQALDKDHENSTDSSVSTDTRVPVNEDYLFDVRIERRELEPAYWLGPVYEVRRGSWFFQEGAILRPCDENLANQLEEGYLKNAPWRRTGISAPRSASQPRSRPSSLIVESRPGQEPSGSATPADTQKTENPVSNSYRLFGSHMNTTVTYMDASVAYLAQDDFMSRVSSTVYERFGAYGGTKVVRGWSEATKSTESRLTSELKDKARPAKQSGETSEEHDAEETENKRRPKRNALERQLSSLAGLPDDHTDAQKLDAEEAQAEQEREMEDAREKDGDNQSRQIDHLVLITHGIGQRLGIRLDSINFVHDVNTMRKTMKAVYEEAPDLQAISGDPKNCRIQYLPICWRHLLDFPKQSLKHNREELDIGDVDSAIDNDYPSLQDITVEGVPAVRNLITDLAMDVLLYQSAYREHIASIVQQECNRVYKLFRQRTGFSGKVSLCGHSLGSAVLFDILCRQEEMVKNRPRRVSSKTSREYGIEQKDLKLDFEVDNFFTLGSPIALFQMLKGRVIAGRGSLENKELPMSPFDPDPMTNDPFDNGRAGLSKELIPITTSSPKCNELFNIFHPTDPIAYRIEPLISPAMASLKPQPLPYTKKGLFGAPGIGNISQRVGQQFMSSWYSLTSGVASSLINRSLGITGEEQALPQDKAKPTAIQQPGTQPLPTGDQQPPNPNEKKQQAIADHATNDPNHIPTLIDTEIETLYSGFQKRRRSHHSAASDEPSGLEHEIEADKARKLRKEEAKVKALNSNGRVDYHIQEGMFDVSLLASIASHLSYWADEDVHHFMIGQMLKKTGKKGEGGGR